MESELKTNWESRESSRGRSTVMAYEEWHMRSGSLPILAYREKH